jgi:hypothetical protein
MGAAESNAPILSIKERLVFLSQDITGRIKELIRRTPTTKVAAGKKKKKR